MPGAHSSDTLFTRDDLVGYANRLLEGTASKLRVTAVKDVGDRFVHFEAAGPRGARLQVVAPMGRFDDGFVFFRSLLRVTDPKRPCDWLVNGQSGRNTSEIAHYGESGPVLATTLERIREYRSVDISEVAPERREKVQADIDELMARAESGGNFSDRVQVVRFDTDPTERSPLHYEAAPAPGR
jgi:hypothetical protein